MKKATAFWLVVLLSLAAAQAGDRRSTTAVDDSFMASESARIEAIVPLITEDRTRVELHGNTPVLYTSYQPDPSSFVIEIRDVDASALPSVLAIDSDEVGEVRITTESRGKNSSLTRIEFTDVHAVRQALRSEGTYLVAEFFPSPYAKLDTASDDNSAAVPAEPVGEPEPTATIDEEALPVDTAAHAPVASAAMEPAVQAVPSNLAPSTPATQLLGVHPEAGPQGARIVLSGNGQFEYQAFALENPDRLVLDLVGVSNQVGNLREAVDATPVRRIRVSQFREGPKPVSRVVLDLTAAAAFQVIETAEALEVVIAIEPAVVASITGDPHSVSTAELLVDSAPVSNVPEPAVVEPAPAAAPAEDPPVAAGEVPLALAEMGHEPLLDPDSDYVLFQQDTGRAEAQVDGGLDYFETKTISGAPAVYTGEPISVNFVEADLKNVFLFFADFIGLNIVIDPEVGGNLTMRLNEVPWDQAFDVILRHQGLEKLVEGNVVRIATTEKLRNEAAQRRALKRAQEEEVDAITFTKVLSYAKAQDVLQLLQQAGTGGVKSDRGFIAKDDRTNTLIITDLPSKREAYEKLIEVLDTRTQQVMIEARIVETDRNFEQNLGVEWSLFASADPALGTQTNLDFPHRASLGYDVNLPSAAAAQTIGISLGNVLDSVTLDLSLQAFENDGKVRILSSPKIATQNNQSASIEQGTQIPVVTTTAVEINVQYISASLKLEVTPQITAEETIIMDITVENNSPDFVNRVGDVPPIITEKATTQILVRNGSTAVIGGIFKLNESVAEAGVPGLRKLPVLGWLFKNRSISKQNTELLVFITPRILTDDL